MNSALNLRKSVVLALVALALVIVGCGSDDKSADETTTAQPTAATSEQAPGEAPETKSKKSSGNDEDEIRRVAALAIGSLAGDNPEAGCKVVSEASIKRVIEQAKSAGSDAKTCEEALTWMSETARKSNPRGLSDTVKQFKASLPSAKITIDGDTARIEFKAADSANGGASASLNLIRVDGQWKVNT